MSTTNLASLLLSLAPRQYALFISHAWDHNDEYEGLVNLLNSHISFRWNNLSVPVDSPLPFLRELPKSYRFMVRQLDEKIKQADCLLVLARMYVAHRGWIQSEIEAAKEFRKPVIAVAPRGSERFPETLANTADERVGWNVYSIVNAIQKRAGPRPLISTIPLG